ncbi:cell division protein FtsL [Moraxella nasovis]|uniref:cell division protein FtsL n=1 Tax=Moraxella nasovis TaxID=2904121 RepID=UPI001F610B48|nr:cell division protein FtsL [Moraxella nasovis]UNU72668.1 cell division protein FtsL [Moraxella nasovis]
MTMNRHAHLITEQNKLSNAGIKKVCFLVLGVLFVACLWAGASVARQTQEHHNAYRDLQKLKSEMIRLKIEEQRLLIEQQTFSSTPQVAQRATTELGMFFPTNDDRQVIVPASGVIGIKKVANDEKN